jgi:ribonuclease BN (tRNA processing enzyme)
MDIRVLGCSGGIGKGLRTTSFLVGEDVLIDAGSGVSDLTNEEMKKIKHIFLTHSHLDHICCIPLLVDSIFDDINEPITIHAQKHTIKALQEHIFNWVIWPDFSGLPSHDSPVIQFETITAGDVVKVGSCSFEAVRVKHIVPTVGYIVTGNENIFAFSGDTTTNDTFWDRLNQLEKLDVLVVESAFSDQERELSEKSEHYCPELLAQDLQKLNHSTKVYLTHAKPGEEKLIFEQCKSHIKNRKISQLNGSELFKL